MNITNPRVRAATVFLLAILIIWFRAPDRLAHGFLWAEDASVFIAQAHQLGRHSILFDYAGYLHLLPRLIAYGQFTLTPIGYAPYVFVIASLLVTAAACAYIAAAVRAPLVAMLLGLALVLSPQQGEVLLSITNLQWMMFPVLLALLWECLFDPPTSWIWPRALVTAMLGLTGPFGVLVSPAVAIAAFWKRKLLSRKQIAWLACYALAVLGQAWIMHTHPAYTPPPGKVDWLHRAPKELFVDLLPGQAPLWLGWAMAAWLMVTIAGSDSALIGGFICAVGIAIWGLGAYRVNGYAHAFVWYGAGSRYLYIPLLMFGWASILAATTARSRAICCAAGLFAGIVLLASATRFEAGAWKTWTIVDTPTGYELTVPPDWTVTVPR
ncbi:hypothetical protein [Paraburkholderia sp. ZP32-5]|uniref:hypothetical protein n=1 Tax=Paraburkholderia sp. ZP32-5 TaxID=2883245 RepID=UPI001F37C906|nr:hypothetical protein [Paraburkholderia sp. ZP32-5]